MGIEEMRCEFFFFTEVTGQMVAQREGAGELEWVYGARPGG